MSQGLQRLKEQIADLTWKDIVVLPAKQVGRFMVFPAIKKRAEYRSVVYNWVLQKQTPFKRLAERSPTWDGKGWKLTSKSHPGVTGYVEFKSVTKWQFIKAFMMWIWLDDDSVNDTTDLGYVDTLVSGERKDNLTAKLFRSELSKINTKLFPKANAFDKGDELYPFYDRAATIVWTSLRNSAMNLQYYWTNY